MRLLIFMLINLLLVQSGSGQILPVIKAKSKKVDVQDGKLLQKGVWNLTPEVRPDVYQALEPIIEKRITFYTDIDSIAFNVTPDKTYDFLIVLNGKDTCYTRISTVRTASQIEAQAKPDKLIAPAQLQQDFNAFRDALEKNHAGLYTYQSKPYMDRFIDSCYAALHKPMTALEFGKTILRVISALEDGHTGSNVPRLLMNYYNEHEKVFPLYPYFVHDKAYVLCGGIENLPAGTEIIKIDGRSIKQITEKIYQYLPSDGTIQTKKR